MALLQGKQLEVLSVLAGYSGGSVISRFQTMVPSTFSTLKTKDMTQVDKLQEKNFPGLSILCNNSTTSSSDTIGGENEFQNNSRIFPLLCREVSTIIGTSKPNSVFPKYRPKSALHRHYTFVFKGQPIPHRQPDREPFARVFVRYFGYVAAVSQHKTTGIVVFG